MQKPTALARLGEVAEKEVLPLARRMLLGARRRMGEVSTRVLGTDFDERSRRIGERYERRGGDPFGLDPMTAKYAAMVAAVFHRAWFRTVVDGIENVPHGKVLLVANHSGQVPIDGAIIGAAMFMDAEPPRMIRAMVEKWAQTLPFVGTFFSRVGQVVGVPDNCRRLLEAGEAILVFPEGVRGVSKPFTRRYQLEDFGTGFMRLAIEAGAPILPIAVIGAEEQYINLGNVGWLAKALGAPVFPLLPQIFVPGGMVPLPTRYHVYFGEPLHFTGDADDDDAVIEEKVWVVRQTIQSMINRGLKQRKSLFF